MVSSSPGSPASAKRAGRSHNTIQSAARGIRVIRALTYAAQPQSLAELSARLGLHKTTLLRLLRTLIAEGIVVQDVATKRYAWNRAGLVRLALYASPLLDFAKAVQGTLDDLAVRTAGTAILVLPDYTGRAVVAAMTALPPAPVCLDLSGQPPVPMHAAAGGKCYLAFLPEPERTEYIRSGLRNPAPHTIASADRLRRELRRVREQGYARSRGEAASGADCVAVPLRDPSGTVGGALAICYPTTFPQGADLAKLVKRLRRAADAISGFLTYQWWAARVAEFRSRVPTWSLTPDSPDPGFGDDALPAVRSAARVVRLLALLFSVPEGLSVSDAARRRGLHRITAMRLLRTLERERLVVRDAPGKGYRLSPLTWTRTAAVLRSAAGIRELARGVLQRLADATGAAASIVVPDATGRLPIDLQVVAPDGPVRMRFDEAVFPPLHATSGGKCYLAAQSPRWVERYIEDGLAAWTPRSISSPSQLRSELELVRKRGYALNLEESDPGLGAVAVPLRTVDGTEVGAVTLCSVTEDITQAAIGRWLPLLRAAANDLSPIFTPDWREAVAERR